MEDDDGYAHSSLFGNLTTEELASKIVLTAIIVLFMAVLFVLLLHLHAKLYCWRMDQQQQQQSPAPPQLTRRHRGRFIFVPGLDSLRNTGLSPSQLSSLPTVVFRQVTFKDGLECAICLSELVNGDKARLLPNCNHSFHADCIDMWFQSHSTCPICRNTVLGPEQASSNQFDPVSDNAAVAASTNNHDTQSPNPSSSPESSNFPTNVLVWGSQDQVSTGNNNAAPLEDSRVQEAVVVLEISNGNTGQNAPSSSSSSTRFLVEDEEPKSPMTTRLRSLKRFLSRDKRVACRSGSSSTASASATDA
ncbi:PREDICTED: RING-H2 finger protein ATL3-like [Tarenaya hassleriana]|uniref:RING-H2 finger protein ATL3-like n=1 Tax=Tarenaya hassleriana TaxID=28532 RepID=UPI00053C9049|nr:PREDICTED: RING-H2 finger protein ATL3-like [Tarenaya hassleriana]